VRKVSRKVKNRKKGIRRGKQEKEEGKQIKENFS